MSRARRSVRVLFAIVFALYAIAVTYPGIVPFNRIRPFVFGLPFVFFWIVLWIVVGLVMLIVADVAESQ